MTGRPTPGEEPSAIGAASASSVARGGAANLVGALIYGASGFALLLVLTRGLGIDDAGVVIVAIAVFNVLVTLCALGTSTGMVRAISRLRALGEPERLPAILVIALVPVTALSSAVGVTIFVAAPTIAGAFSTGGSAEETTGVLRAMAPLLPFATLHPVIAQATRGFNTMYPLVLIERIGRSVSLPILVGVVALAGGGPRAAGVAWAASNVIALCFSARALLVRVRSAVDRAGRPAMSPDRATAREFWSFTAPRAVGQTSDVSMNWFDTILVGGILGATQAGIYASGTRYLQPGLFTAEALMHVTGPRVSGLLATDQPREASRLVQVTAGWQTTVVWPAYLLIALFPVPLLRVFGDQVTAAEGALVFLAVAMLLSSPLGSAAAVILMAGRARQAMVNTLAVLVLNVGGNLLLVGRYGITAAGAVWALSLVVAVALPAWQSHRGLGVTTWGPEALTAAGLAAVTVGSVGVVVRLVVGDGLVGLVAAGILGVTLYGVGLWRLRSRLHLDEWWAGIRRRPSPAGPPAQGTS
ncbi:hypothetical protein BH23ACT2_BH23ACT2_30130 [soil metagenome]